MRLPCNDEDLQFVGTKIANTTICQVGQGKKNGHGYEGRGSKKGAVPKLWKTEECRMTTTENGVNSN